MSNRLLSALILAAIVSSAAQAQEKPDPARGGPADTTPASHEPAPIEPGHEKAGSSVGIVHETTVKGPEGPIGIGGLAKEVRTDSLQRSDGSSATTVRSGSDRPSLSATVISEPRSVEQPNGATGVTFGGSFPLGNSPARSAAPAAAAPASSPSPSPAREHHGPEPGGAGGAGAGGHESGGHSGEHVSGRVSETGHDHSNTT